VKAQMKKHVWSPRQQPEFADDDIGDLEVAGRYLKCSPLTIRDWIQDHKFCHEDGLRYVGHLVRVHMPTLRRRVAEGKLMQKWAEERRQRM
jgi:hypothetical protein